MLCLAVKITFTKRERLLMLKKRDKKGKNAQQKQYIFKIGIADIAVRMLHIFSSHPLSLFSLHSVALYVQSVL